MSKIARIFLDNAAGTPVDERVLAEMEPYWRDHIGNAGALHQEGVYARHSVEQARSMVADVIHAHGDEIFFMSGSTEANNVALLGVVRERMRAGVAASNLHVITSAIEHSSVEECMHALEHFGVHVSRVPVDAEGRLDQGALRDALREETVLVSVIHVNNEIGTIEDLAAVGRIVR